MIQVKQVYRRTEHPWLQPKISAMLWLAMAGGLPIGQWRAKAGWDGSCKLCGHPLEDTEHALMTCSVVAEAWHLFQELRQSASLSPAYTRWTELLYGLCQPPGGLSIEDSYAWNSGDTFVSNNTAWEVLRSTLLWRIWVQKCNQELNGVEFRLTKALYFASKDCIHVGMEV